MNNLTLALIGKKLTHSFSKLYFDEKFRQSGLTGCSYTLVEIPDLSHLKNVIEKHDLTGFNVTIPYKQEIMPLLDHIDPTAKLIGAVNTVLVDRSSGTPKTTGYNTDAPAFVRSLQPHLLPHHRKALILGTGGAAHAASWGLASLHIDFAFVSRNPCQHPNSLGYDTFANLDNKHFDYQIIINATPVGMFPDTENTPWPHPELLSANSLCYDMVYNPSPTRFLNEASARKATTVGGLDMLHIQADMAFDIWCTKHSV